MASEPVRDTDYQPVQVNSSASTDRQMGGMTMKMLELKVCCRRSDHSQHANEHHQQARHVSADLQLQHFHRHASHLPIRRSAEFTCTADSRYHGRVRLPCCFLRR